MTRFVLPHEMRSEVGPPAAPEYGPSRALAQRLTHEKDPRTAPYLLRPPRSLGFPGADQTQNTHPTGHPPMGKTPPGRRSRGSAGGLRESLAVLDGGLRPLGRLLGERAE